ncbi:MAG TPA: chemotaxis protein CheA, partial [Gammaproteobacteria bacterium]|nr:chemotaxis protein CheA [Gammaproteobacteria bacterium]
SAAQNPSNNSQSDERPVAAKSPAAKKSSSTPKDGKQSQGEGTVRVDTARLDDIMNMVGELVLVRNRIINLGETIEENALSEAIGNLDLVTSNLQSAVMKTRMQPIKKVFGRFPRVVRDLARNLGKDIRLELEGEETDLDKNLVEALADPLVHLVRNACDHGIESPDERAKMGKPQHGTIRLSASQEGDHILLSIYDDGAGMDPDLLRQKAVEKGLMDEDAASRLDDRECFDLIFQPGFSTKHIISDVSGRGVGMDVVKTKISSLNGTIVIDSQKGAGTNLMIKVPLTLAIMPTLMVMLGGQAFAFPLASVSEIFNLDLSQTNVVDGQMVVTVRNKPLPLFYLNEWLKPNQAPLSNTHNAHVVVVNLASQKVGFVVNKLLGQEEVVIKPLGAFLHGTPGMAGATITGDGRIALILDVPSLVQFYAKKAA